MPQGATVETMKFWSLAKTWYKDRFDPNWVPKTREDAQSRLSAAGLTGDFWVLG